MSRWSNVNASICGLYGCLRAGSRESARLGSWRVSLMHRLPRQYELRARITYRSEAWFNVRPVTLVLHVGNDLWEWPNAQFVIENEELVCSALSAPTIVRFSRDAAGQ